MTILTLTIIGVIAAFPALLRWTDNFVYFLQNNIVVCPRCHSVLKRVNVKCPGCNNVFANLYPTYGHPLFMKCFSCGSKLATTRLFGRANYESFCPSCMAPLGLNASEGKVVAFPIAGGAASGKTTFLMSSLGVLTFDIPNERKWKASFPYKSDELFARRLNKLFKKGELPNKTNERVPQAFCLDYKTGVLRESLRLCIYDPSGETFAQDYEYLEKQRYYDFMSGLIFIVDPFSLPKLREKYKKELEKEGDNLEISEVDPMRCLERLLHRLDEYGKSESPDANFAPRDAVFHGLSLKPLKEIPCAIVIAKSDVFNLDRYIGDRGVEKFLKKHPRYDEGEATDLLCRYWLRKWGGQNLLGNLDSAFGKTRCFSVSALGKPDSFSGYATGFKPRHVDAPFNWLLEASGTGGMNKWGVLLFLFGILVSVVALVAGAHRLMVVGAKDVSRPSSVAKESSSTRPEESLPVPKEVVDPPALGKDEARRMFRTLCRDAYKKSADGNRFDRDSILSLIAGASAATRFDGVDRLKTVDTLEFVVEWRRFRARYVQWREKNKTEAEPFDSAFESARMETLRLERTARQALFEYFADDSIADKTDRSRRVAIRDRAFDEFQRRAEATGFRKDVVQKQIREAATIANLTSEGVRARSADDWTDFLIGWHKFDLAFRVWQRSSSSVGVDGKTVKDADKKRAVAAVQSARNEIEKVFCAVEEAVVDGDGPSERAAPLNARRQLFF